jgi:hypothetical protein
MKAVLKKLGLVILSVPLVAIVFLLSPFVDIITNKKEE